MWTLFLILSCGLGTSRADGTRQFHEDEATLRWLYSQETRYKRNNLPDIIILRISLGSDKSIVLNLKKENENLGFAMAKAVDKRHKTYRRNGLYGMYQDDSHEASFTVVVEKSGKVFYYGTFGSEAYFYDLLPENELAVTPDTKVASKITLNGTRFVVATEKLRGNNDGDEIVPAKSLGKPLLSELEGKMNSEMFPAYEKRNLTVEVYLVLDYTIFQKWYKIKHNNTKEAIRHIYYYYINIFNGLKQRYEGIDDSEFRMTAALAGLYVATTLDASPFPESTKYAGQAYVTSIVLGLFNKWTEEQTDLPRHDVVALISDFQSSSTNGIAYIGTVCTSQAVSITRESGPFQTADTLTHEIGHNLGAEHDGSGNACSNAHDHIMTPKRTESHHLNSQDEYAFSNCSRQYFKRQIEALDGNNSNCLVDIPLRDLLSNHESKQLPGQVYDVDAQCALIEGIGSGICGGSHEEENMCAGISCYDPTYKSCNPFRSLRPADGTSCGNKKWCMRGKCVESDEAPAFPDSCMHGDDRFRAIEGLHCDAMARNSSHWCYYDLYRNWCCKSCAEIRSNEEGCEYGDKSPFICEMALSADDCREAPFNASCCRKCRDILNKEHLNADRN